MRATSNRTGFDVGKPEAVLAKLEAERESEDAVLASSIKMLLEARPTWHSQGACRGSGIDFTGSGANQISAALQICGGCPVRADCLDWALEIDDRVAILGGMTPSARRRLVKARHASTIKEDSDAAA
jgi:WhiB family redox-sensing transcriptional regulator